LISLLFITNIQLLSSSSSSSSVLITVLLLLLLLLLGDVVCGCLTIVSLSFLYQSINLDIL